MSEAEQPMTSMTISDAVVVLGGVSVFAWWLLNTSLGRKALRDCKPRRNRMAPYTPFVLLFIWFIGTAALLSLVRHAVGEFEGWPDLLVRNGIAAAGSVGTVVIALIVARAEFARGLRGFGLRLRTLPTDIGFAFLHLLAIWPLIMAVMSLTVLLARQFAGEQFEVPSHEALKIITESPSFPLQVLMIVTAVILAPLVEEMLFRGLLQSMVRSYFHGPWTAILISSAVFAVIHENFTHWPSLFVLAVGLGYAYEKSGSLLRPILMHAAFNGISIVTVLIQPPPT